MPKSRICKKCEKVFHPQGKNTVCETCSSPHFCHRCKKITEKVCGRQIDEFTGIKGKAYCISCMVEVSHKFYNENNIDDWVECKICGYRAKELAIHIKLHNITSVEYKAKFNVKIIKSFNAAERYRGKNNPGYGHGGTLSPWSSKSEYHTNTKECHASALNKAMLNPNHCTNTTKIETYLNLGMSLDEAKAALSERQTTFSKEICIAKHGETVGLEIWNERQAKWLKSFKKTNFSKISQELFDGIMSCGICGDIYYATRDRPEMSQYVNKEYTLCMQTGSCKPDFICLERKKIIEFDGDYWHGRHQANPLREAIRDDMIRDAGYVVMHVKENDYRKDKQGTIDRCIKFLTQ